MRKLVSAATKRPVPNQSICFIAALGCKLRCGVLRKSETRMKLIPAKGRQILTPSQYTLLNRRMIFAMGLTRKSTATLQID
jgi:hypothetical protein